MKLRGRREPSPAVGSGLAWGGSYGDMMHFDMRNATDAGQHGAAIQGAIGAYIAKKRAEAKKVEADDGHGGNKAG